MAKSKSSPKAGKKVSSPNKSTKSSGKKWVIAVDPFAGLEQTNLIRLVSTMADKVQAPVYAAYVLAPAAFNWTGEFSGAWMKRYRPMAEEKLSALVSGQDIRTTVVPCHETGVRASVKTLLSFTQKVKAECLVLSTHARQGLERLAMGSFAETAILTAKVPVLVVNPGQNVPSEIQRILVATDLSKKSEKYVMAMGEFARKMGAEIVLFYQQPDPLDPMVQQGVYSLGGGWVSVQSFIDEEADRKRKLMEKWQSALQKKGLKARYVIDSGPTGLIEAITQACRTEKADLVSVLTEAGGWSAALLGSVARGLVRSSPCPVFVQR